MTRPGAAAAPTAIVPYGRSFDEYCLMFGLSGGDTQARILGVGDGPADFNAQASTRGWNVVSVDPMYRCQLDDLEERCLSIVDQMIEAVSLVPSHWTWTRHESADTLKACRLSTTRNFLADFAARPAGRYVAAALPALPFRSASFDIAVCAHLLFSWLSVIDLAFHLDAVLEMLRVANEVRIFPTGRNLASRRSQYADLVCAHAVAAGYHARFRNIQPGRHDASSECLIISRRPAVCDHG